MAVTAIGGTVESVALTRDHGRYPMTGALYDVGGHRLHLNCTGTGSPTVVLENGLNEISPLWSAVTAQVASTTRVCAYDRAGQGWSDDADGPQDGREVAADLHTLLARAGEHGPYVLAGHSSGGTLAMTYAARYPAQVAGMVLLDSSSPHQYTDQPDFAGTYAMMRRLLPVMPALARVGALHLAPASASTALPPNAAAQVQAFATSPRGANNMRDEQASCWRCSAQAQALTSFDPKPLAVVTARENADDTMGWAAAQDRMAALSTNSTHWAAATTHVGLLDDATRVDRLGPRHHRSRHRGPHRHAVGLPMSTHAHPSRTRRPDHRSPDAHRRHHHARQRRTRPTAPHATPRYRSRTSWAVLALALTAQILVVLDISVVNTALPAIGESLRLGSSDLQWLVTAYLLLSGGGLLLGGRIADLVPRHRVFLTGMAIFTGASLFSGFANNAAELIAARATQGLGAALMTPAALSLVMTTYSGAQRTKGLALWGAVGSLGIAAGVLFGGALTTWFGWQLIFWVNVPIGVVAFALGLKVLPKDVTARASLAQFDLPGALTVIGGLGALMYGLASTSAHGWLSVQTLVAFAASAVLLTAFVRIETRAPRPLVPPHTWKVRTLVSGTTVMLGATAPARRRRLPHQHLLPDRDGVLGAARRCRVPPARACHHRRHARRPASCWPRPHRATSRPAASPSSPSAPHCSRWSARTRSTRPTCCPACSSSGSGSAWSSSRSP